MDDPTGFPRNRLRDLYPPADPHGEWSERRASDEVRVEHDDGEEPEVTVHVYSWKRVRECFRHEDVGLSEVYRRRLKPVTGRGIHCLDPPEHTELRSILQPLFAEAVEALDDHRLRELITAVADDLPDRGTVDLVRSYTSLFPSAVLHELLGLPGEDLLRFRSLTFRFALDYMFGGSGADGEPSLMESRDALLSYFREKLTERRQDPDGEDLLSRLVHFCRGGRTLEDEEILAFLLHLAPAGTATTAMATGMLLYGLLTRPGQERLIRKDPSRVGRAVEEGLRWSPPFAVVERQARRPIVLDGTSVPGGTKLRLYLAAANRDPERFDDPQSFDLDRDSTAHLSFAAGPHVCLGESLARREMRTALRVFYDRVQDVRIDPEREDRAYIGGRDWRGIPELPVVLRKAS